MSRADRFWSWFVENEERFRDVDVPEKEALLDEILEHVHEYCDQLYFETGGDPAGPWELIISAGGDRDHFAEVSALVAAAPDVEGWEFIAFKPASGFEFVTDYEGLRLDPQEMWFLPVVSGSKLGLRISSPTYDKTSHDRFLAGCYIVLDCGLGELPAAEDVHHVEACPLPEHLAEEGWIELNELADYISWKKRRGEA